MFPSGTSMAGFGAQQWAAFAAIAGQPTVGNTHAFQLSGVDSNGVVLGPVGPSYVRLAQDSSQPSVLSGSSLHSAHNPYGSHPTLGYALQPSVENTVTGRQIPSASLPPYLQHYSTNVPVSQTLPFPHASIPYGQSFPYIQPLLPALCNGGLSQLQQCQTIPQQQAALVSGFESSLRVFDSLKNFGALPQEQNRRTKSMITSKTNLYISGLNESDTDETVRSLVGNVVKPKSCKAMMNNGVCKGYGFIDCATEDDAEKAKNYIMANATASGRKLLVKFAHENEKDVLNVYVRHLPADFTKDKLESLFRKYGEITSVKLLENEDRLTGIGFVRYARAEQAERAIEQMNAEQLYLGGNTAPIMCKLADKPNARRRIINSTHTTSALMALPLTNSVQRHTSSFGGSNSQRLPVSLSQTHQSSFSQTVPFSPQLISPLNQPQVILHNINAPSVSPHSRAVLSSGVLANGNSSSLLPLSFPSVPPGNLSAPCPTPNRPTPLIGPPPQTLSASIQSNPNATCLPGVSFVASFAETPLMIKSPAINSSANRFPNALSNSTCFPCECGSVDPLSVNKFQMCTTTAAHCATPLSMSNQIVCSTGTSPINPQVLIFTQAPDGCTIQNSVPSVFPFFSCGSVAPSPQISLPSAPPSQPSVENIIQRHTPSLLSFDSSVHLASSELQALSLTSDQSLTAQHVDPLFCSSVSAGPDSSAAEQNAAHSAHCSTLPIAAGTTSIMNSPVDASTLMSTSDHCNFKRLSNESRFQFESSQSMSRSCRDTELLDGTFPNLPADTGASSDSSQIAGKQIDENGVGSSELSSQEGNGNDRRRSEPILVETRPNQSHSKPGRQKRSPLSDQDLTH